MRGLQAHGPHSGDKGMESDIGSRAQGSSQEGPVGKAVMVACEVVGWLGTLPSPSCPAHSLWQDIGNDSCHLSNCSTIVNSKHNPLTHVWLQVLFNQVLPAFLPLLIWSHFVPCLHRANSVRSRSSQEPSLATGQQLQSSNTLCSRFPMLSWKTRSPANSSLSKGPALSWRNCNSQVFPSGKPYVPRST